MRGLIAAAVAILLGGVVSEPVITPGATANLLSYVREGHESASFDRFVGDLDQIHRVVPVAKFRDPLGSEAIIVIDGTPNVQVKACLVPEVAVIIAEINDWTALPHNASRRERVLPFKFVGVYAEGLPPRVQAGRPFHQPADFAGWQVSHVSNVDIGMAFIHGTGRTDAARFDADISALEDAGIALLSGGSVLGGLPELVGREPQGDRRESENDRKASYEFMLVGVQEVSNRQDAKREEKAAEGGTVSLIVAVGGCALVYWLLARRKQRVGHVERQEHRDEER